MKRLTSIVISAGIILGTTAISAFADGDISVYVDGGKLSFDVLPIIENDRTLVPMRAIFEALGAEIDWNGDTKTVTAYRGDDTVSITIGSDKLYKNGTPITIDVPAMIVNDRTLVPVRAISESFDLNVDWDANTQSVLINTDIFDTETAASPAQTTEIELKHDESKTDFPMLTDKDMERLISKKELIRYEFEQIVLPDYALGTENMYEKMNAQSEEELAAFSSEIVGQWNTAGAKYILQIMNESEYEYTINPMSMEDIINGCGEILEAAGLDAYTILDGISLCESEGGTRMAAVIFKSADSLVNCKFLGIAASKNGKTRYFTAENDIMQPDDWFLCEVMTESRGTIAAISKQDDDLNNFFQATASIYENGIEPLIAQSTIAEDQ